MILNQYVRLIVSAYTYVNRSAEVVLSGSEGRPRRRVAWG
jgi:hypothetical protein